MKRRLPILLALVLSAMWLLLNDSVTAGQTVLGVALALVMVAASARIRPDRPRIGRPLMMIRLFLRVSLDIVRSNLNVARIVLGLVGERRIKSGFLEIPLDLRDPHGLAVLAIIVTSTPGTVWAGLKADGTVLTLHVLDLYDEAAWIDTIKNRYEKPLMEIFR
jgi:multicomponent K+:H+ antiporter subunit E